LIGATALVDFLPVAEFSVYGVRTVSAPGIGAPLGARAVPRRCRRRHEPDRANVRVAATALLRLDDVHDGIVSVSCVAGSSSTRRATATS